MVKRPMKKNADRIKGVAVIVLVFGAMAFISATEVGSEKPLLKIWDPFPAIELQGNPTPDELQYLGVAQKNRFSLKDIAAKIVLVEFFNKFCPHCQQQAPILNQLYHKIQQDSLLQTQVRMVGIGVGNNQRQIEMYRAEKSIPFPLFADPNYQFHDDIGRPRTPFIVLFKKTGTDEGHVAATYMGLVAESDTLLQALRQLLSPGVSVLQAEAAWQAAAEPSASSKLSDDEFMGLVKAYFKQLEARVSQLDRIPKNGSDLILKAQIKLKGKTRTFFVSKIYRPTVCDVCHDAHFWFVFDDQGTITHFAPIHLTKAYNKEWREKDVQKVAQRIVNHRLTDMLAFDPEVDAVTSATMTTGLIYDTINRATRLFAKLKEDGIIK